MNFKCCDHFLDSNILIGSRIRWDAHFDLCDKYMAQDGVKRYTSEKPRLESEKVFGQIRQNIRAFLVTYLGSFERRPAISLDRFIERKIAEYKNMCMRTGKKKIWGATEQYIKKNFIQIKNATSGGRSELIKLSDKTGEYIQGAIDSLMYDCKNDPDALIYEYPGCPVCYENDNNLKKLKEKINNENDVHILLDSFFIMNEISKEMHFITFDKKDILINQDHIEKTLKGIFLYEPKNGS